MEPPNRSCDRRAPAQYKLGSASAWGRASFARASPSRGGVWGPSQGPHLPRARGGGRASLARARRGGGLGTLSGSPSLWHLLAQIDEHLVGPAQADEPE